MYFLFQILCAMYIKKKKKANFSVRFYACRLVFLWLHYKYFYSDVIVRWFNGFTLIREYSRLSSFRHILRNRQQSLAPGLPGTMKAWLCLHLIVYMQDTLEDWHDTFIFIPTLVEIAVCPFFFYIHWRRRFAEYPKHCTGKTFSACAFKCHFLSCPHAHPGVFVPVLQQGGRGRVRLSEADSKNLRVTFTGT